MQLKTKETDNRKVLVWSSYFKHKSTKKSPEDDKQERLILSANQQTKSPGDDKQEKLLVENDFASDPCDNVILKSFYRTKTANNKVVVRSSYFQYKSVNKNDQVNERGRLLSLFKMILQKIIASPCKERPAQLKLFKDFR
ncbi:hypothetical protein P3X46_033072 [Hevea brasiliensis]|uniref:Uncharacterized protein n=1 Tax=Hevea brasiliensis TaxID=3981 RepID=A0ABQ9KGW7_HEVBR|nr:hypothetical protein P3X46_033072 [Hevea brasiliensis]